MYTKYGYKYVFLFQKYISFVIIFWKKIVECYPQKWNYKNVGDNMDNYQTNSINWSEKVKDLDESIRREIGLEGTSEAKHILIKVQTKSAEAIEPAFIVGEDETFLDLFVLSPQGPGITSTAVLKDNIQSVGVIGGVSAEKLDPSEIPDEKPLLDDVSALYQ